MQIQSELKDQFDRDGFVVCREFLPESEFAQLRRELERYIISVVPDLSDEHAFYDDKRCPETLKQLQHMNVDPFFRDYVRNVRWRSLAENLLDEESEARDCEWFNKPRETDHPTPPHQDNFYFNLVPPSVVTLWLALEDVDEENGCLRYVRGSHKRGCRPHARSNVLGFSQAISDYGPTDESGEVPIKLRANDLVAHHGWTIHRAEANRSRIRHRRSFAIVFRGTNCQVDEEGLRSYQESLVAQHTAIGLTAESCEKSKPDAQAREEPQHFPRLRA
jgi:phytanoyl-CoA hydroxylase